MTQTQFGKYRKIKFLLAAFAACGLLSLAHSSSVRAASTITVNSTSDAVANDGVCTLREAIIAANTDTASGAAAGECAAGSGADTIDFNITGTADFTNNGHDGYTIQPTSSLPQITEPVTIDGYSQSGAQANTAVAPSPLNGTLLIEVKGTDAGATSAFDFIDNSDNSAIKGLVINDFSQGDAVTILADNIKIQGDYIGTDPTGFVAHPNVVGVNAYVQDPNSGHDALIGGLNAGDRNLISGNTAGTTGTAGYPGSGWTIQGNYAGVAADGLTPLANSTVGGAGTFSIDDVQNVTVGGNQPGAINVIGESLGHGIAPSNTTNLTIEGNYIGLGYDGTTVLGNTHSGGHGGGVTLGSMTDAVVKDNRIAGWQQDGIYSGIDQNHQSISNSNITITGNTVYDNQQVGVSILRTTNSIISDNIIFGNVQQGVVISDSSPESNKVSILGNSIHDNNLLGIDLGGDGITYNDHLDTDSGANDLLNYPLYTNIAETGGNTQITYNLDVPAGDYRIEFYSNTTADPSGFGEGQTYLGYQNVTSNGSGTQSFTATLTGITGVTNLALTTTQIDPSTPSGFGATSEFGGLQPPVSDISASNTLTDPQDVAQGATIHYAVSYKNNGPDPSDLTPYAPGGGPFLFYAVHPDLTATGLGAPGPYPGTNYIANPGNPDVLCLWAAGGLAAFNPGFSDPAHDTYGIIACFYSGSDTTLASGASLNLNFSFTVSPTSQLQFGTYAYADLGTDDPDIQAAITASNNNTRDMIDLAQDANINNFAAAVFPLPVQPGGGDSTTKPVTQVPPGHAANNLADTGENVWLIALASAVLILASITMIWKWRSTDLHKV